MRCLQIFSEIARSGSFAATARHLGISKATVTKHIASIEKSLGARLLNRTTKQVKLTDAGLKILQSAQGILLAYDEIEMDLRDSVRNPKGVLRIGTPPVFGAHYLVPLIVSFLELHSDVQVVLSRDDGSANLVAEGLDLSVRISPAIQDSSYVSLPLLQAAQVLIASPAYLARHGHPAHPRELQSHNCLIHSIKAPTGVWQFSRKDEKFSVRVRGSFHSNLGEPLQIAAMQGHGISMHPYYMVEHLILDGRLAIVLPDYVPNVQNIFVVYSTRQNLPLRVRTFLDHLKTWAEHPPGWAVITPALKTKAGQTQRRRQTHAR